MNLLITPEELTAAVAQAAPLAIIDVRDHGEYLKGHLPGARHLREIFTYLATSSPEGLAALQDDFAELLGKVGVSGEETVVIYEDAMDNGYGQSTRGWFLLRYLGHPRVQVLDGGLRAWIAAGYSLESGETATAPAQFTPRIDDALMLTWEDMLKALDDPSIIKLDVRDYDEWAGESSSPYGKDFAPRKGRLPHAVWIEWRRFMDNEAGYPRFRSVPEIREICREAGIEPTDTIYLYCFKGARASNTLAALLQAGFEHAKLYFGSWNEWSRNEHLPIDAARLDHR